MNITSSKRSAPDPALAAIVLGAGRGRRFGGPKAFLFWPPSGTLISRAIDAARPYAGEVRAVVAADDGDPLGSGVHRIVNPCPEQGMATSLRLGLCGLPAVVGAVMILLADQPFVTPADIEMVLAAWSTRPPGIRAVRPYYEGVPGHPVVLERTLVAKCARAMAGDEGLGRCLHGRDDVLAVPVCPVGRPSPGFDIDTLEEYRRALAVTGITGGGGIMSPESPKRAGMERPERRGN